MYEDLKQMKDEYIHELTRYYREKGITKESIEAMDMMVHTIKNLCKIIDGYNKDDGYSMRSMPYSYGYPNMSYARQRDSMGRYSGDHDLVSGLHDLMNRTTDEHSRRELQDMINRVEMR